MSIAMVAEFIVNITTGIRQILRPDPEIIILRRIPDLSERILLQVTGNAKVTAHAHFALSQNQAEKPAYRTT